jgi:hypothetical protein
MQGGLLMKNKIAVNAPISRIKMKPGKNKAYFFFERGIKDG